MKCEAIIMEINFFVILLLILNVKTMICLRVVRVVVPAYRLRGEPARLECVYELGGDRLYSVKWYRDNEEFYRYIPKLDPKKMSYRVDGIKVDVQNSDDRTVTLRATTLRSRGLYRCEVSAEAPSFASAHAEALMEVLYIPKDGPFITMEEEYGEEEEYLLNLNCTSGRSHPAPILKWYIDDNELTDPALLTPYPVTEYANGLLSSRLGVRAPRRAHLRCVASLAPELCRASDLGGIRETGFVAGSGCSSFRASWVVSTNVIVLTTVLKEYF